MVSHSTTHHFEMCFKTHEKQHNQEKFGVIDRWGKTGYIAFLYLVCRFSSGTEAQLL